MNSYFRLRVQNFSTIYEDQLSDLCFSFGATGLSEALVYMQPDLTYDPDIIERKTKDIDVYFAEKPNPEIIQQLQTQFPNAQFEILEEQNKDWLEEWKKGFKPFCLVDPYWVVPSWEPSPVEPKYTLQIDPGMAFGTGTHATTKMASYFVRKLCSRLKDPEGATLLDVGTGTAILAMLAHHHGVRQIVGLEIDPEARRVARENVKRNNMESIEIREEPLEELHETFDIVVANIIDGVLIKLKADLLQSLNPGGHLFLTGILCEREEHFFNKFIEGENLTVIRRIEEDEWVGYWLQSPVGTP
jgi:ribosomal protein L11 methyltransferase